MPPIGPRPTARKRAAEAHRLRCLGRTWDDIANTLGYGSPASAYKAATAHIRRMPAEDQDMARAYSAGNYHAVIAALHDLVERCKQLGRTTAEVQALEAIASVQERRDKLLGLHVAVASKVDVNVQHSAIEIIDRAEAELLAIAAQRTQPGLPVLEAEVINVEH
jgi:hypothetical protein